MSSTISGIAYHDYTYKELRGICKRKGYANYSTLNKKGLFRLCVGRSHPYDSQKPPSAKYFKRETLVSKCRERGIKGYSRLGKPALKRRCVGPEFGSPRARLSPSKITYNALYAKAKQMNIRGRSGMSKQELFAEIYRKR